ncbi:hypothetical protein BH09MYX1_BH09MYX1_61740 [soil metagenome]
MARWRALALVYPKLGAALREWTTTIGSSADPHQRIVKGNVLSARSPWGREEIAEHARLADVGLRCTSAPKTGIF